MDSVQRIKAEVERLKAEQLQRKDTCKRSGLERIMHKVSAYNDVLRFIEHLGLVD